MRNLLRSTGILLWVFFAAASLVPGVQAGSTIDRITRNGELILGTPGDFPPFSVTTAQGEIIGFDVSLSRELARSMGVNLRIVQLPFTELIPALNNEEVDIILSGLSMTPKRNMLVAFVGPYGNSGQAFLTTSEILETLAEPSDLNREGLRIATLRSTTADLTARAVLPKTTVTYTESLDEALILLLKGEVDGLISDFPYCKVAEFRYREQGLKVFDEILSFEHLGIGVSDRDPLFINLLQNYLNLLAGSGALQAMQEYWFKNSGWVAELPDLTIFKDF
jgi:polar amino acid transport system substrate-binding protein